MTPDREAPTRPRPPSRPAAPSPGPPTAPPPPLSAGAPHLRLPQLQNRLPCSLPHASPQSCVQAPGAPWPTRLFTGTVFVSLPPAPSLSPRTRPSPGALTSAADCLGVGAPESWGWGALAAPGIHWTVTHPQKVDSQPASRLLLPDLSASLTCSPLPRPKGGSRATWEFGSPSIDWESMTWVGVLVPGLFLDVISHLRPFQ